MSPEQMEWRRTVTEQDKPKPGDVPRVDETATDPTPVEEQLQDDLEDAKKLRKVPADEVPGAPESST